MKKSKQIVVIDFFKSINPRELETMLRAGKKIPPFKSLCVFVDSRNLKSVTMPKIIPDEP